MVGNTPNPTLDGSAGRMSDRPGGALRDVLAAQPRWALVLRGIAGLLLGVTAFILPGITFLMLIGIFGGYLLVDGILALVSGWKAGQQGQRWWPFLLEGVANLLVGGLALAWPGATALALVYLVAFWSVFTGVLLMFPHPDHGLGTRVLIGLAGLCSILLGIGMILQPVAGSLAVVWMTGVYGLAFGTLLLTAGLRSRPAVTLNTLS